MSTINGGGDNDTLNGTAGNDSITGDAGDDSIDGGGGSDTLSGDAGFDTIRGGEGNDSISGGDEGDSIDGGAGNDSIVGGTGYDTIQGGDGDDTIQGNDESDSISGGAGNDQIDGGSHGDTIDGGEGADTIAGGAEDDSIFGGDGTDQIDGGDHNDSIDGGSGADTIDGGAGEDSLVGGSQDDSIRGGADSDTLRGYNDDDTLLGEGGYDMLFGGAGFDSLDGGDKMDTLEGGEGDDTLTGGSGADTFVFRDGHGSDIITDFQAIEDQIAFDMNEIGSFSDVTARLSEVGGNSVITFDNGDQVVIQGIRNSDLGASNFTFSAAPVCLLEGTLIHTERGDVPIEALSPDDRLWTKDHGWQALKLITVETLRFRHRDDPAKPVLIPAGSLGAGLPREDLITSPQHRVLLTTPDTGEEVLVPAVKLIGTNGVRRMRGKQSALYLNVVMERHSIIQAAGCWVESMLVTSRSLERQRLATRRLLDDCIGMAPARRVAPKGLRRRALKSAGAA